MNKQIVILIFIFQGSNIPVFSQSIEKEKTSDSRIDSLVAKSKQSFTETKVLDNNTYNIEFGEILIESKQSLGLYPIVSSVGISPYFFSYPLLLNGHADLTDFYNAQQELIYRQFYFFGGGEHKNYTGLGEYMVINGGFRYMPTNRLFADIGGMFSRQFYFASFLLRQDFMGVNTKVHYALTNNIRLKIWGQYIYSEEQFSFLPTNSLFPHTGVGASVSVDFKKDTEMSVGAEYQYDNKSQKWKVETAGRISIGF